MKCEMDPNTLNEVPKWYPKRYIEPQVNKILQRLCGTALCYNITLSPPVSPWSIMEYRWEDRSKRTYQSYNKRANVIAEMMKIFNILILVIYTK